MSRPPKGSDDQRSEFIRCRVRPGEYLRILKAAERAGLSPSEYTRRMLLSGEVAIRQMQSLDPEAFDQLRRIGINLNQAVHKLHSTGRIPPDLARAAAAVEGIILGMIDGA